VEYVVCKYHVASSSFRADLTIVHPMICEVITR
jgi:hypothetical protein